MKFFAPCDSFPPSRADPLLKRPLTPAVVIAPLALGHHLAAAFPVKDPRPSADALQDGDDGLFLGSQGILHARRDLVSLDRKSVV